jgi:hypothetical protein
MSAKVFISGKLRASVVLLSHRVSFGRGRGKYDSGESLRNDFGCHRKDREEEEEEEEVRPEVIQMRFQSVGMNVEQ